MTNSTDLRNLNRSERSRRYLCPIGLICDDARIYGDVVATWTDGEMLFHDHRSVSSMDGDVDRDTP